MAHVAVQTRKMHWRWAVILRPWARNSAAELVGGSHGAGHAITNDCFLTTVVEIVGGRPASAGPPRPRRRRPGSAGVRACGRLARAVGPRLRPPRRGRSFDRAEALRRLGDETFDVLVIGGGITGAGVALDAASRGLRTALVERHDFASGTSSKSSKMVHGGLRYLQQRDFRLVYEALHERQRLLENAPHLVAPLPFLIPLFGRDGLVNKSVARTYATALTLYDLTGGLRIGKRHRRIDQAETLAHLPTLRTDRLVAGFIYYDARADDARLTLTLARTAALDHGAVVANYAEVRGPRHRRLGCGDRAPGCARRCRAGHGDSGSVPRHRVRGAGPGRGQRHRGVGRRRARPGRGVAPALDPAGQGHPHHGAARQAARRHRGRHPRAQGPALDLRGAVARRRRRVPGHHRHRLGGPPRRPRLPARRRRLRARRGQRRRHRAHRARRRHRGVGRAAAPAGSGRRAPRQRPHRRPVAPAHRARLGPRHGHRDGRQAHHLPADGRGHGGRRW